MKNLLVMLIVMATGIAQAQQAACLKLNKIKVADHLLLQAGETRAELIFKAKDCYVVTGPERPTVTLEYMPGLRTAVSSTGFSHIDHDSVGSSVVKAQEMSLVLKLSASPGLPVGEHSVHGMVTYYRLDSLGAVIPETVAVRIPFKVAPPRALSPKKKKSGFLHGLEIAGEVIVGIPLFVVMLVWCPLSGTCPSC